MHRSTIPARRESETANIAKLLGEETFAFTVAGLTAIHRRIFEGVFKFAGEIRDL